MMHTPSTSGGGPEEPWQLRIFRKTLKKKQKLKLLANLLGDLAPTDRVLLLTNGDNNGALNHHFRKLGGRWTWGEFEEGSIPEMQSLLGEPVSHVSPDRLPFTDAEFDAVVVIDVHEHLEETSGLNSEIHRIVKPGGRVIVTTPNGDSRKIGFRIKEALGMNRSVYGHVRDGYTIDELETMLVGSGLVPLRHGSYSNLFTEMVELGINLGYVKILNRKSRRGPDEGHAPIAPSSAEQVKKVEKTLKVYGLLYPFCRIVSAFDVLLDPFTVGYAVAVESRRPGRVRRP